VTVEAEATEFVISVEDDGGGIDRRRAQAGDRAAA
jgi:chemotaxis protein histidine kinase CheA